MISRYKGENFFYILKVHKQVPTKVSDGKLSLGLKFFGVPSEDSSYKSPTASNPYSMLMEII